MYSQKPATSRPGGIPQPYRSGAGDRGPAPAPSLHTAAKKLPRPKLDSTGYRSTSSPAMTTASASNARPTGIPRYGSHGQPSSIPKVTDTYPNRQQLPSPSSNTSTAATTANIPHELRRKQPRNVLRRKSSIVTSTSLPETSTGVALSPSTMLPASSHSEGYSSIYDCPYTEGMTFAPYAASVIPELDRYRSITEPAKLTELKAAAMFPPGIITSDLPPPGFAGSHNRLSQYSGYSSSARCSESPGPSAYSRDTTPTSISSLSPSTFAIPGKGTPRLQASSPARARPPVIRRRGGTPNLDDGTPFEPRALPALRESTTSSSSNSTVRAVEKPETPKKKKRLTPPPPSPPPRKSSQDKTSPAKSAASPASKKTHASPSMSSIAASSKRQLRTPTGLTPRRPSRDGTPDLPQGIVEPFVVQSNLASITTSPTRQPTIEQPLNASNTSINRPRALFQTHSRNTSRNLSQSPTRQTQRGLSPAPTGLGIVPVVRQEKHTKALPSAPPTKSRFGFLSRLKGGDSKTDKLDKKQRKGPAAGTGYEGYGRYAVRGRTGSTSGATSRDGSSTRINSSQESLASMRTQDKFLADRMSPVIIQGGGGIVDNRNASIELSRVDSNQSHLGINGRFNESSQDLSRVVSPKETGSSHPKLRPSALPRNLGKNNSGLTASLQSSTVSDGSDIESGHRPTLAYRRSMQRLKSADSTLPLRIPEPINTSGAAPRPMLTSNDTTVFSDDSRDITDLRSNGKKWAAPKKLAKRQRSRSPKKWSLFGRNQSSGPKQREAQDNNEDGSMDSSRSPAIAHYAIIDSNEPEKLGLEDLNAILKEAKELEAEAEVVGKRSEAKRTSMSRLNGSTLRPLVLVENNKAATLAQKPSRLPQVGRIPQVHSSRPSQARNAPSPISFSRPFTERRMSQMIISPVDQVEMTPESEIANPPAEQETPEETKDSPIRQDRPFFVIAHKKDSSQGTSSTSSAATEWMNTTAVIPTPDDELGEDEVWDEYDEFLGDPTRISKVARFSRLPRHSVLSTTSSMGVPFQFEHYETQPLRIVKDSPEAENVQAIKPPVEEAPATQTTEVSLGIRIKEALGGLITPSTPGSFSDILNGYSDRHSALQRNSKGSRHLSTRSGTSSFSGHSRKSLLEITAQVSNSPLADVNLRVASMNIAKWLTFSNVLFSPAREHITRTDGPVNTHSILVVDGLGNDDWSFYLAETYPSVTIYNLSPTPASPSTGAQVTSSLSMPSNHRQVQYLQTTDKFPFPSCHFTAVIVRFPVAGSEAAYRNLINESKRVLKPAGYLELSVLDLDMNNMGVRTRRIIRELKVKMSVAQPDVSLAPASDTILRLLGRRGFRDVKSCTLGVPVAGLLTEKNQEADVTGKPDEDIGILDMMKDDSSAGDESITKMVAKVGRWWYTQCYEQLVLPNGDASQSMWCDEKLMEECQRWGTGFKLLVCYAQKPIVARRRTLSV